MKVWIFIGLMSIFMFLGTTTVVQGFAKESLPPVLGEPTSTPLPPTQKGEVLPKNSRPEQNPISPLGSNVLPGPGVPPPRADIGGINSPPPPLQSQEVNINYVLGNLKRAINTAKIVVEHLNPGKIWIRRGPQGEIEVEGAIIYQGVVVGSIKLDPLTGEALPDGYHGKTFTGSFDFGMLKAKFQSVFQDLQIAEGVEYREPEASWIIPIIWEGRIVSFLKIYYDGLHIVPDFKKMHDMTLFGR